MSKQGPVFIADTCVGGLSVIKSMWRSGRASDAVFMADYEVNPLGVKSDSAIEEVVNKWLNIAKEHSDTLVIACNTLSIRYQQLFSSGKPSLALKQIVSMVDCFEAMITAETEQLANKRILVIGTEFTAGQTLYPDMLRTALPGIQVDTIAATELERRIARFLPIDSTGNPIFNDDFRQAMENTEIAVLACTCFPMVQAELQAQFPAVRFYDPGAYCSDLLTKDDMKDNRRLSVSVRGNVVSRAQVIEFADSYLARFQPLKGANECYI